MVFLKETGNGVIFHIHVVPKSAKNECAGIQGDAIKLKITAPPVEGQANDACIRFLSDLLSVKKNQVTIISGHKSRKKTVAIQGKGKKEIEAVFSIPPSLPFMKED
ncbi:MAG TPA: YggU family protein [Syntrophaceae bacterium]|nr:YggU family protein [Syntrophaceae bacterium]